MAKINLTNIISQYDLDFNSFNLAYRNKKDTDHIFFYMSKKNNIQSIKGYIEWNKANTIDIYDLLINGKNIGDFRFKNPLLIEEHHVILLNAQDFHFENEDDGNNLYLENIDELQFMIMLGCL